jgi:PAS domain S-box-containing protein
VSKLRENRKVQQKKNEEFEALVAERTAELLQANERLQKEIEEHKQAEGALEESEERLRQIAHSANAGLFEWNASTDTSYWSSQHYEIFGFDPKSPITFERWLERVHPEDRERIVGNAKELMKQASLDEVQPYTDEYRIVLDEGAIRWIEADVTAKNVRGEVIVRGAVRDISERKRMEDKLRESEERFRIAVRSANFVFARFDRDLRYTWLHNPHSDFDASLVIGKRDDELEDSQEARRLTELKRQVVEKGTGVRQEISFSRTDGIRTYDMIIEPLYDGTGALIGGTSSGFDVTERKKAEQALQGSNAIYRAIARNFPDGAVYVFDHDLRFQVADGEALARLGFTREGLEGKTIWEATDGETCRILAERYPQVLAGNSLHFETDIMGRTFSSAYVPIRNENGRVVAGMVVSHDITERKRMEEELQESESNARSQLREIEAYYATAPIGLCVMDTDLRFLRINERLAEINGVPAAAHLGRTVREVVPALADFAEDLVGRIIESGEAVRNYEFSGETAARPGETRVWREDWFPLKDSRGNVVAVNVAVEEITERKRMEENLTASRNQLQSIIDNMPAIVYVFDLKERFLLANSSIGRLFGTSPQALIGKRRHEVMPKDIAEAHEANDRRAIEQGHAIHFEEYSPEHSITWLTAKFPLRDAQNNIYAVAGISTDISERKRMEQELQESRDQLELRVHERTEELVRANEQLQREVIEREKAEDQLRQSHKMEAVGTLAGGIAHDFNNILAVILGNAELAIDDVPKGDGIHHNLDAIAKAAERGRDLVKQILTFSRKNEQQQKNQSLTPLIEESYQLLRASIPSTIDMKLALNTKSDMARVNEAQFQQILMNLCVNAAHAMRQNGGVLEISLDNETLHLDGSSNGGRRKYLKLSVRDTGTGMDEEIRKRIFDPFFTTKEPGEGTGMGLAVVYGIVEAHNGFITVQSEPGKGSLFNVFMPKTNSSTASKSRASEAAILGGEERIMFIDDEDSIVDMASAMLERLGYEVSSFTDPEPALDAFAKAPQDFDLVITDQTMPKMTGAMLAEKLKAIRPDIPVMLCTGYSHAVSAETAKSQGIDGYVMKPLAKTELAEAIRKVLNQGGGTFTDFSS